MSRMTVALGSCAAVAIALTIFVQPLRAQNLPLGGSQSGALAQQAQAMGLGGGIGGAAAGLGAMSLGGVPSIREDDTALGGQMPSDASAQQMAVGQSLGRLKPNDFQRFVLEATGNSLPIYGQTFFDNFLTSQQPSANPFAPVSNAPVAPDYTLGPGDQLIIRGWGAVDINVRATVDRNGAVTIPRVGAVPLAGVRSGQVEEVLRKAVGKYYKGFELSVTLGRTRAITVYVVGQARRPGGYTLSSSSTLTSALFATGGPNAVGSMRHVQLKRAGQVVAELDLYNFLAQGSNATDSKVVDGDIIFIPPAVGHVALVGKVNTPAIYELKSATETIEQLISVAGGLPLLADQRRVTLERLNPASVQPRSVESFALDASGLQTQLRSGDLLTVLAVAPELANAVTLRGNVAQPVRQPWREGMRVSDLIPSKEALISRDSIRRQNEALFDANQRERAQREREMIPDDLLVDPVLDTLISRQKSDGTFGVLATGGSTNNVAGVGGNLNLSNKNNEEIVSSNAREMREARQRRLFVQQPAIRNKNVPNTLADTVGNLYDEINWDYALIERVNRETLSVTLVPFNLGRALSNPKTSDNQTLQPGDTVTVFSVSDIRVPISKRRAMVRIEGEVASPGIYQVKPGESLTSVLARAGGLTQDAYLFGSELYREEVRRSQLENLEKLIRRLEAESSGSVAQVAQSMGASADGAMMQARITAAQQAQRQALERVRQLKPEGRISMNFTPDLAGVKLPEVRLQNGDRFVIPSRPDFVYVFGAVNTESALLFKEGESVSDYLKVAGVSQGADRDGAILVRADGSAVSSSGWFGSVLNTKVMPGDSIVLPEKIDRESAWSAVFRNTKDITQILYQLGLGAAAYKTLRN